MDNTAIIESFYSAFARGDWQTMGNHYHQDAEFEDPAFGRLNGKEIGIMWRMLIERAKGQLSVSFGNIVAGEETGSANWEASYIFSKTGRNVVNKINARFVFKGGKIYRHEDYFSLWRWARQAFGLSGFLIGYTSFFRNKLQSETRKALESYKKKNVL